MLPTAMDEPPVVTHFPAGFDNPYLALVADALKGRGVSVELRGVPSGRSLRRQLGWAFGRPIVHWHWVNRFYQGRTAPRLVARLLLFASFLLALRCSGTKMVLTVHNLLPHDCRFPPLHRLANRVLGVMMHRLVVHSPEAGEAVARSFGARRKIRCVEHVDYGAREGVPLTRCEARERLGLPAAVPLVAWFGQLRPYKGVERLLDAAGHLRERGFQVLLMGRPETDEYRAEIERAAARHENVSLRLHRFTDEELAVLLTAADVAAFPYAESLTSGAAHMALAYGVPVACPRTVAFAELIRLGLAVSFDGRPDALAEAVARASAMDRASFEAARVAYLDRCSLPSVGRKLRMVYEELLPRGALRGATAVEPSRLTA